MKCQGRTGGSFKKMLLFSARIYRAVVGSTQKPRRGIFMVDKDDSSLSLKEKKQHEKEIERNADFTRNSAV